LCNLRESNPRHNSNNLSMYKRNKSGVNGVSDYEHRARYRVMWYANGKLCSKNFSYGPKSLMTKDEAFTAACAFRRERDAASGCTNGHPVTDL
jgi:hypothetical protein